LEQQLFRLEPRAEGIAGDESERIIVASRSMRHLARQPAGMGGKIDEPDAAHIGIRSCSEIRNDFDQRIGQPDRACRGHVRQQVAGKSLGDRADAQDRVAVGRRRARPGAFAEASDRYLAVAHRADHQSWNLGIDEQNLTGEVDNLVEHRAGPQAAGPAAGHGHEGHQQDDAGSKTADHQQRAPGSVSRWHYRLCRLKPSEAAEKAAGRRLGTAHPECRGHGFGLVLDRVAIVPDRPAARIEAIGALPVVGPAELEIGRCRRCGCESKRHQGPEGNLHGHPRILSLNIVE